MITKINLIIANAYLVRGRKTVIVDTGAPGSAPRILNAIKRQGINQRDVSLILLTHAHSDHAGSAGVLREALQAPVAVHREDVAMLERGDNGGFRPVDVEAAFSKPFVDRPFPPIRPDIVLDGSTDFSDYGLDGWLMHTPGHSDGSISLLLPDGNAIVGDILRGGIMGGTFFPARPTYPFFLYDMADKAILHTSIRRVLDAGATYFYTGHGGPILRANVERWLATHMQPIRVR